MKVLWITRTCPFPPNDGEKLRQFNLIKALAPEHEVTLVCRVMTDEQQTRLPELRKHCAAVHAVRVPPPRNHLERLRWLLPFLVSRYPVATCTVFFRSIDQVLRKLAATERFDVVQVEHPWMTIYLDRARFQGRPSTVLTMHNIDFLRNERIIEHTPFGLRKLYHVLNQTKVKRRELATLARYDTVVAMSELEREAMLAELPQLRVAVIPNGVDCQHVVYQPAQGNQPRLVFVASLDSEANHDGAMYFIDDVLPLLKLAVPNVCVSIVGRAPRPSLQARGNGRDVVVTGAVPSVLPFYGNAAVAIVPLRSGGGTRLKILEAMAAGTPVVSTTVGAEGLDLTQGEHLLLADDAASFAAAIQRLLADPELRAAIGRRARQHVERHFDWGIMGEQQKAVYRAGQANAGV